MQRKDIISKVKRYLELESQHNINDPMLLAVSGGLDSMVMTDIMLQLGYNCQIAHVNYRLRDKESDMDAAFVELYCRQKGIIFHLHTVDDKTRGFIKKNHTQEKARKIRYTFFYKILRDHDIKLCYTAHTLDDTIETLFVNLMRGSGIAGLKSIPREYKSYRRPLLDISRPALLAYASANDLRWREDESNRTDDYDRNYIRHHLIPALVNRWPDTTNRLQNSLEILNDEYDFLKLAVKDYEAKYVQSISPLILSPISKLREQKGAFSFLHHLIAELGFNTSQIASILSPLTSTGAIFYGHQHHMLLDRDQIIISPLTEKVAVNVSIQNGEHFIKTPFGFLTIERVEVAQKDTSPNLEYIDEDVLHWPLLIRTVLKGSKIAPLGMKGKKKLVSKVLIDLKVNRFEKEKQLILYDQQGPIWLIGRRLDHRFRLKSTTKNIVVLRWESI